MDSFFSNKKIVLGTSIAPTHIENQVLAVKSWVKSGFKVISCNVREEIEIIEPYFAEIDIEFVEVKCDIDSIRDKPLPYIYDIMMAIYHRTKDIGGYINSDIYLETLSEELYKFLYKEAEDSLLIVKRNEVNCLTDIKNLKWKLFFSGIDMFLIDKKFIPDFFDDGFFVQSSWDIGILLKAKVCGIKIKELMNPVAFHKRHTQICKFDVIKTLVERLWEKYFDSTENAFEDAMQLFYSILFEDCKQICFLNETNLRCLFVTKEEEVKKNILGQEFTLGDITIQRDDKNKEKYDYVFYIPANTFLSPVFCKTVIFIMKKYEFSNLEVGKFFVSLINGKYQYNNLSKSIELLEYIHEQCSTNILVCAKKGKSVLKKITSPISYELLDINNKEIFKRIKLTGSYYLAPAGMRAEHWHYVNSSKLKDMHFLGFLDNYKKGENIYPMKTLEDDSQAQVIVACKFFFKEIMRQLQGIIDSDRLVNAGFACYIDQKGVIYYFDLEQYKKYLRSLDYEKEEESEKTRYS